jgi:cytochrome c5
MKPWSKRLALFAMVVCLFAGSYFAVPATADDCAQTYENFGKAFLDKYCNNCHASTVKGFARKGAPADLAYDNLEVVKAKKDEMVKHVVMPGKKQMPPSDPKPSDEERAQFKAWLECEYK